MALHIFTVNERTFKIHLNYMFAGTGKDGAAHQTGALADISGIREGDKICFYVMNKGFFGFFKAKGNPFFENYKNQYLDIELGKTLTYRIFLVPYKIYESGKSEWDVLQNPDYIKDKSIYNMQWSWIFKKLNANRGCLSIDTLEEELLENIISANNVLLSSTNNYDYLNGKIINCDAVKIYEGDSSKKVRESSKINIEEDLKILFVSMANENKILDQVLNIEANGKVNFISNEFLCSFSERKLDLAFGTEEDHCILIELKNEFIYNYKIYNQLKEYSRYISNYKIFYKKIIPILIIRDARLISVKKNSKYYKYLSKSNMENNITSDWYSNIIANILDAKNKLKLENIKGLEELQVFSFSVNKNNELQQFKKII